MRIFLLLIIFFFVSCSKESNITKNITFTATNFPISWSINYISGNSIQSSYFVKPDIDPAYWQPTSEDLQKLNKSDWVILHGASYEKWLSTISLENTFDSTASFKEDYIKIKDALIHEHDGEKHTHDGIDFNTWLDFDLFLKQAENISKHLKESVPNSPVSFEANLKSLNAEILDIKKEFAELTKEKKNFFASHPVYDYFARQNGLSVKNFHWEPESMPDEKEWQKLEEVKAHSSYMIWEDEPIEEIKKKLTSMGIKVIVFRTCGNTPPSGDFIKEMKENITNFKRVLNPGE